MRKRCQTFNRILLCFLFISMSLIGIETANTDAIADVSKLDERWHPEGIYGGYDPGDEVIDLRTGHSKTFRNLDGTYTVQFAGLAHYRDEKGAWQDIDFNITPNHHQNYEKYSYCNTTHEIKSYFTNIPNEVGMKISHGRTEFEWWKSPELKIISAEKSVISTLRPNRVQGTLRPNPIDGNRYFPSNRLYFEEIYPGIDEEFEVEAGGIVNNIIINELHDFLRDSKDAVSLGFSQFIPLPPNAILVSDGMQRESDFSAKSFSIQFGTGDYPVTFAEIIVFDSNVQDKFQAKDFLRYSSEDKLKSFVIIGKYHVEFVNEGILLTASIPLNWLNAENRRFPVTIDPDVLITPESTIGTNVLWDGAYCDMRTQNLYMSSFFTDAGIPDGAVISAVGLKVNTVNCPQTHTGLYIRMKNTTESSCPGPDAFSNTGWTDCYNGSHSITSTGWYNHSFHTNYTFDSGYNVYIDYSMDMSAPLCADSVHNFWAINICSYGTCPQGRSYIDCEDDPKEWTDGPGGSVNLTPSTRITYDSNCSPPSNPTSVSASPTNICAGTATELSASSSGAVEIHWFIGSCSGTYIGSSTPGTGTLTVYPDSSTTYYARGYNTEGPGCYSSGCANVSVTLFNEESAGVWTGYSDTLWSNAQNWGHCNPPDETTDAFIPASPAYGRFPSVDTDDGTCVCRDLTIEGSLNGVNGNIFVYGEWLNNGTFNSGTGTVTFIGDGEPAIGGTEETDFSIVETQNTVNPIDLEIDSKALEIDLQFPSNEGVDIRGTEEIDLR